MHKLTQATRKNLYAHLSNLFDVTPESILQTGTSIIEDTERDAAGSQIVWTLPGHVVVQTHPDFAPTFQAALLNQPVDYCLAVADLKQYVALNINLQVMFYTVDTNCLVDLLLVEDFHIRQITKESEAAFQAFQARCSDEDKAQGQISLDDDIVFAAFEGDRIVAAASSFEWLGFVDFGVLSDPAYRGRGLGKSVIAAISSYYLAQEAETRLVLYRHEERNTGSAKVAKAVGYQQFATLDYINFMLMGAS